MLTRFESKLAGPGTAFLAVVLFLVTYMGSKAMQGQSQRPRRTVSELNYLRGNAKSPVRLQGLKIGNVEVNFSTMAPGREQPGRTVKPDEEFDADDDFLEKLSFETINVSEKRIVYIRFMVHLYSAEAVNRQSFDAAFAVDYGRPEIAGQGVAVWKIEPGGTATIRIPGSMIADVRKVVAGFKSPIVRVGVYANMIDFEDGSGWTTGAGHRSGRVARNVLRRPAETAFSFGGASAFMGRGAVLQDEFGPCQDGCFNSGGTEVMSCDVLDQSCTGYRENWHNPDHPGPARSGTDTLRRRPCRFLASPAERPVAVSLAARKMFPAEVATVSLITAAPAPRAIRRPASC